MALVTYPITAFPNQAIAPDQFRQQVAESTLSATLIAINCTFTEVQLEFDAVLTPPEETTLDALVAAHTATGRLTVGPVATLPNGVFEGENGFATDGRKVGEGVGNGTGVPIYWSQGAWRVFSTDSAVQS